MQLLKEIKLDLAAKPVLVRADLNAENAEDAFKLHKSLSTIRFLLDRHAKVVVMSHRGRPAVAEAVADKPKEKIDLKNVPAEFDMRFCLDFFEKQLGVKPVFLDNFDFADHVEKIRKAPIGSLFILQNVRLHPGEDGEDKIFARGLASLGELYVNDAFASWHPGASVTMVADYLPSYAGLLIVEEIGHLVKVMENPHKPLVVVLGGGKAKDKFEMLKFLHDKADSFLLGGVIANTFLKSCSGSKMEDSVVDEDILSQVCNFFHKGKVVLPVDFVRAAHGRVMDVGKKTIGEFTKKIQNAGTVVWNGPLGFFEQSQFRAGSEALAREIAKSSAYSVVGGGETSQLLMQLNLAGAFTWVSTGGGAMLAFLSGKKLPSLEALGYYDGLESRIQNLEIRGDILKNELSEI